MSSSVDGAVDSAGEAARTARDSRTVEGLARLGLAARGLVWLVLSGLSLTLVQGGSAQADQSGAFRAVADKPFGRPLLVVLGIGFLGYATWLLLDAAVGRRGDDDLLRRVGSGAKSLVYLALALSTAGFLLRGSAGGSTSSRTAEVMAQPGGRTAVGLVGLVALGIGLYLAVKGLRRKHSECLEHYRVPAALRRPAILCGAVGYVGRGVTIGLIGVFLLRAAVQFDPRHAKGLDAALQTVLEQPYGRILLGLTVIGMLAYALWSFFEAVYRDL